MALMSGLLVFCIGASKCCLDICMFEQVCDFPDLGAVISEGNPFCALVVYVLAGVLLCKFDFSFLMRDREKLLLFAVVRIVCHSVFFFLFLV
jgi:hypothetical protein